MEGEGMMRKFLVLKSTSTGGSNGLDDVKDEVLDFVKEKLAELLHFFQDIWAYPAIGLVVVLSTALALLCLYCCRYCLWSCLLSLCSFLRSLCCCPFICLRSLCCCCGRRMRAPGRGGALMPRNVFESNPREYFINLRAGRDLVF